MRTKALFIALAIASVCFAKDIKTVVLTTNPQMHCEIKTDLDSKTVTIEYDAEKTNVENIIKGFKKIKYDASEVKPAKNTDATTGATQQVKK